MTRVLVTGASGLLGLNLAFEAASHHNVFGVVNHHPLTTEAFTVLTADLLKPDVVKKIFEKTRPDWVIHCAALADLEVCEDNPELAYRLNTELPEKLATYVTRGGARLIHVSTDAVFDGERGSYSETDAPNPLSVYAKSKLSGEQAVASRYPDATIIRVNFFGWSRTGKRSLAEFFFNNLKINKSMFGFTDVFFCPLLVNDLAQIILSILEMGLKGLYHVVSSECTSKYEFGVSIARQFGFDQNLIIPKSIREANLKAARSPMLTLKTDKLTRDMGEILPRISPGLERFYKLYQQGYPQILRATGGPHGN